MLLGYIQKLAKADQQLKKWQTAVGCLIRAAEGRDFLIHARIGMPRALYPDDEPEAEPRRKA
jgi:hypothetical protein